MSEVLLLLGSSQIDVLVCPVERGTSSSLHLKLAHGRWVIMLECVEDMQAVVFVKLEGVHLVSERIL